jgi:hypothetical protein
MVAIPSDKDIGYPVEVVWAYDQGPARNLSSVNKFVVHDTEGTMASDVQELTRQDAKIASCHALIAPSGKLVFMVPLSITAWTPGNDAVAEQSINVEMSGFATEGYTDDQYKSMAAFFRWCLGQGCSIPAEYAARTGRAGILGHQDVLNPDWPNAVNQYGGVSGHTDPGPLFSWSKFIGYIKEGKPVYDPCLDYFNAHGGEAVFGKPTGGQYGTNGSVERNFEFAHMYLDKATGKVVAEMKDRVNPLGFNVGPGIYGKCQEWGLKLISNEQWFSPDKSQPGLGKMSRAYAQDSSGKTFVILASEQPELGQPGQDTPWKVEQFEFIR